MLAVFIGLTQLTTIAYAWQLDVDLSRSTFGSDRVCAAVHGPAEAAAATTAPALESPPALALAAALGLGVRTLTT